MRVARWAPPVGKNPGRLEYLCSNVLTRQRSEIATGVAERPQRLIDADSVDVAVSTGSLLNDEMDEFDTALGAPQQFGFVGTVTGSTSVSTHTSPLGED